MIWNVEGTTTAPGSPQHRPRFPDKTAISPARLVRDGDGGRRRVREVSRGPVLEETSRVFDCEVVLEKNSHLPCCL